MANMLSIDQVADLAYAVGLRGNALAVSIAIAMKESTLDAEARGDTTIQTSKWGPSIGLWQVRSLKADRGTGKERDELALYSPAHNARSMYTISSGGTKWTPWSVYTSGAYRGAMASAEAAARRREQAGGSGSLSGGGAPGLSDPTAGAGSAPVPVDLGTSSDIVAGLSPLSLNYSPPRQVADLRIERNGARVAEDITDYVVAGRVELTSGEASELSLTVHNPGRRFLAGSADIAKGSRLTWSGIEMRIVATELGQGPGAPSADITARSEAVYQLKRDNLEVGVDLAAKRSSPTEWLLQQMNARVGPTRFVAQGSPRRADIAPTEVAGKPETAWQMASRMADELGYWLFEAAGVVYFGQPSWIMRNTVELRVAGTPNAWGDERLDALEVPTIRESADSATGADLTCLLPRWRGEQARPGHKLVLQGIDGVPRLWLVTRVSWPIDGGRAPVTVDATEPIDPPPKDTGDTAAGTPSGKQPAGADSPTSGGAIVNVAQGARIGTKQRITQFGAPGDRGRVTTVRTPWGMSVTVHVEIRDHFVAACEAANRASSWRPRRIDSYAVRPIRGSSDWSLHSFGLAWDIFQSAPGVPPPGGVWAETSAPDRAFREAFRAKGFHLGADYRNPKDYPHIEWASAPPTRPPS